MFAKCPAGRLGTADEVANIAELLLTERADFITGSDSLIDDGATVAYFYGELKQDKSRSRMAKKILILSSSPRKCGNSDVLCDEFLRGAEDRGHVCEKIFLRDKKIN